MSETVEVKGLPTPPKGWQWNNEVAATEVDCLPNTTPERWYYEARFYLRPIQPKTVMVTLPRWFVEQHSTTDMSCRMDMSHINALHNACRAAIALASNTDIDKREKCGTTQDPEGPFCNRAMGHEGKHRG